MKAKYTQKQRQAVINELRTALGIIDTTLEQYRDATRGQKLSIIKRIGIELEEPFWPAMARRHSIAETSITALVRRILEEDRGNKPQLHSIQIYVKARDKFHKKHVGHCMGEDQEPLCHKTGLLIKDNPDFKRLRSVHSNELKNVSICARCTEKLLRSVRSSRKLVLSE